MRIGIIQPSYLPWAGYFNIINSVDKFVYLDVVQFDMSWRNRNRIRTNSKKGWDWLTVPVIKKGKELQKLYEVKIDNSQKWYRKHWNLIYQNYHNADFFDKYADFFKNTFLNTKWNYLLDLNYHFMDFLTEKFNINTPTIKSSTLGCEGLRNNELNIFIIKNLGGDFFLANEASKSYMILDMYEKNNIKIEFHNYPEPVYKQQFDPFMEKLSIIDRLFNLGPDNL